MLPRSREAHVPARTRSAPLALFSSIDHDRTRKERDSSWVLGMDDTHAALFCSALPVPEATSKPARHSGSCCRIRRREATALAGNSGRIGPPGQLVPVLPQGIRRPWQINHAQKRQSSSFRLLWEAGKSSCSELGLTISSAWTSV